MTREMMNSFFQFGGRLYRRHTMKQLLGMDDHMLKDIGLSRADVERIVHRGR